MNSKGVASFVVFFSSILVAAACGPRGSNRNEVCQSTANCAGDLVCVAVIGAGGSGLCQAVNLDITPSSQQCVAVQCQTAADCCATFTPSGSCSFYQQQCQQGNQTYCNEYQQFCVCDPTKFACTNDKCVPSGGCTTDADCPLSAPHCNGGTCVACIQDTDCGANQTCKPDNTCAPKCTDDSECPLFYSCNNGACTQTGCQTDRECVIYEDSQFGFCDTSTSPPACSVKCDNDTQCNASNRPTRLCLGGKCVATGCDNDEECKALLGTLPQGERAVCRAAQ